MITCQLCGELLEPAGLEAHMVDDHDQEPLERWPDGEPVIIDTSLTPDDFTEEAAP